MIANFPETSSISGIGVEVGLGVVVEIARTIVGATGAGAIESGRWGSEEFSAPSLHADASMSSAVAAITIHANSGASFMSVFSWRVTGL